MLKEAQHQLRHRGDYVSVVILRKKLTGSRRAAAARRVLGLQGSALAPSMHFPSSAAPHCGQSGPKHPIAFSICKRDLSALPQTQGSEGLSWWGPCSGTQELQKWGCTAPCAESPREPPALQTPKDVSVKKHCSKSVLILSSYTGSSRSPCPPTTYVRIDLV